MYGLYTYDGSLINDIMLVTKTTRIIIYKICKNSLSKYI